MARRDTTDIGGACGSFQNTQWTQILAARDSDPVRRQEALGLLMDIYWKPVYCYLRRKGCDNEKAKDLTQSFFHEIVLGRDLFTHADRSKGKFRTLLLSSLDHFVISVHRAEASLKRRPAGGVGSLDGMAVPDTPDLQSPLTPEQAFTYAWASTLLDRVIDDVQQSCRARGQVVHWELFQARVVRPVLEGSPPPPLAELCRIHGITSENKATDRITTVKRSFQKTFRNRVRQFVETDDEVDGEITEIMQILSGGVGG